MQSPHPLITVLSNKIVLLVILAGVAVILVGIGKNVMEYKNFEQELAKQTETIDQLQRDNIQLNELLTFLDSDDAVDAYARTSLGYQKEGERAFIITNETSSDTRVTVAHNKKQETTFSRWFRYYFE